MHNFDRNRFDLHAKQMLSHINVVSDKDVTFKELAQTVKEVVGFKSKFSFDHSRPDGASRKLMSVSLIYALDWRHSEDLQSGMQLAQKDYETPFYLGE